MFLTEQISSQLIMVQRNLLIALRNFYRQRLFTSISLIGLSIGLSAFILITSYIKFELSYDKHIINYKNVYRLYTIGILDGNEVSFAKTPGPACSFLKSNYSQIENATRVVPGDKLLMSANVKTSLRMNYSS